MALYMPKGSVTLLQHDLHPAKLSDVAMIGSESIGTVSDVDGGSVSTPAMQL